ncbi:MAG: hypothetical protein AAGA46_00580 [Cyanobacteria bacterium P01_F01_bin.13]
MSFAAISPILAGAAAPTLGLILAILNPKAARALKNYIPVINKYHSMARLLMPMMDRKLADKVDIVDGAVDVLKTVADGSLTVPGVTKGMRKLASVAAKDPSKLKAFLDEVDTEFKATEFNKANLASAPVLSEFVRSQDGEIITES